MKKLLIMFTVCAVCVLSAATAGASDLYDGLAGFWTFDAADGNIISDSSGNNMDGTYRGTLNLTDGKTGKAVSFSASTADCIDLGKGTLGSFLAGSGAITFASWVKIDELVSGTARLFYMPVSGATVGYEVYISSGALRIGARSINGDAWNNCYYTLPDSLLGGWHHIATVVDYKNKQIEIYIDGSKITPTGSSAQISFGADSFTPSAVTVSDCIGGNGNAKNTFNGLMDEVRVYSRRLDAEELNALAKGEFSVGNISFYNADGEKTESIECGDILCRIPVINMGSDAKTVKLICTLNKKSVNTMQAIKIVDFTSVPMSRETAELTMSVPKFADEYYLCVMVWDGSRLMQSFAEGVLK